MNATARGKATPVNLAHHAYWNLGGHGSGSVLGEEAGDRGLAHRGLLSRGVNGYGINYVVDGGGLRRAAVVRDGASGRAMELCADQPGVQFYTANGLSGVRGKGGKV
uniref:Aldose 1-epimerase n=1 Tax=Aegilops tauschii TaxID=37682 RepID=R7VYQ6_AEGTA